MMFGAGSDLVSAEFLLEWLKKVVVGVEADRSMYIVALLVDTGWSVLDVGCVLLL